MKGLNVEDAAELYCELTSALERRPPISIVPFDWAANKYH